MRPLFVVLLAGCVPGLDSDCSDDTDCPGGACVAGQCVERSDACAATTETCDGADQDCDGRIDEGLEGAPCSVGEGACLRQGEGRCEGGQILCSATAGPPGAEVCNNQDDDCDGDLDEALRIGCYNAAPETEGVGLCRGGQASCTFGEISACQGEVLPSDEICDGEDQDCDGRVDEELPPEPCFSGEAAWLEAPETTCARGEAACGAGDICPGEVLPAASDGCNGHNDDCDAEVDEDCRCVEGQPCEGRPPQGLCALGTQVCAEGSLLRCEGRVEPVEETCDGRDEDCDGRIDEDADAPCYPAEAGETQGVGLCRAGLRSCREGQLGACEGAVTPAEESCDGRDEDCDGEADEAFPDLGQACLDGVGGCGRRGLFECLPEGEGLRCSVEAGAPEDERCSGVDEDCDGSVDEGSAQECYALGLGHATANVGECRVGSRACQGGRLAELCAGEALPGDERCEGELDEDCDGAVDEGCECPLGDERRCGEDEGACVRGTQTCVVGGWGPCEGEVGPREESCDGHDEDCDGALDEGLMPRDCYPGDMARLGRGVCKAGLERCLGEEGWGACDGFVLPSDEVCGGEDEDCDDAVDEDLGLGEACNADRLGICAEGQQVCQGAVVACLPVHGEQEEQCNLDDDDCDGIVDEDFVSEQCGTGQPGNCAFGEFHCIDGLAQCVVDLPDDLEVCGGGDEDCDGQIDERAEANVQPYPTDRDSGAVGLAMAWHPTRLSWLVAFHNAQAQLSVTPAPANLEAPAAEFSFPGPVGQLAMAAANPGIANANLNFVIAHTNDDEFALYPLTASGALGFNQAIYTLQSGRGRSYGDPDVAWIDNEARFVFVDRPSGQGASTLHLGVYRADEAGLVTTPLSEEVGLRGARISDSPGGPLVGWTEPGVNGRCVHMGLVGSIDGPVLREITCVGSSEAVDVAGGGERAVVIYATEVNDEWWLEAQRVSVNGLLAVGGPVILDGPREDISSPRVEWDGETWQMAWLAEGQAWAVRMNENGNLGGRAALESTIGVELDLAVPGVIWRGSRFAPNGLVHARGLLSCDP